MRIGRTLIFLIPQILAGTVLEKVPGQTIKTETVCITEGRAEVSYTCGPDEMIHVISVLQQNASGDCLPIEGGCQVLQDDVTDGFLFGCNGEQTCQDDITDSALKTACENAIASFATVSYECISDKPIDVCSTTAISSGISPTVYLISPDFPRGLDVVNMDHKCICEATGSNLNIEILEIRFIPFPAMIANLTLTGENDTTLWGSYPNIFLLNNFAVMQSTSILNLTFDVRGRTGQNMWIRLKGTSDIALVCNSASTATKNPAILTPTRSFFTTASLRSPASTPPDTPNIYAVVGALGAAIAISLIVGAALLYLLCIKPRRLSTTNRPTKVNKSY